MENYASFLRHFFIELCIVGTVTLLLLLYEYRIDYEKYRSMATTKPGRPRKANTTEIRLLFWTKAHGLWQRPLKKSSRGLVRLNGCKVPCLVTRDRSLVKSADAVVFHDKDADARDLPSYRNERQRWVYWNMEPPPNSRRDRIARLRGVFNWTYTYRHDSDVPLPYVFFVNRSVQDVTTSLKPKHTSSVRTTRPKLLAWVASRCSSASHREVFVSELRKYVAVDVYGQCGDLKCVDDPCQARFADTYYFYLALENSLCREYVTEKFYHALRYDMVPVVLGNYASSLAPPDSYIDAFRFPTPRHLASHLKAVAANATLYERYFAWKRTHAVKRTWFDDHCALCKAVHEARTGERKQYADIVQWWHGGDNGPMCAYRSDGADR